VGARCKSEHEDARVWVAESRNGLAPIFAVAVFGVLLAGNPLAIRD
jgi:hypothetical protein